MSEKKELSKKKIFLNTLFFVLGFAVIFALLGVLIQTVLSHSDYSAQIWISRVAGAVIIFFGLFMLDLIPINFLFREHKIFPQRFKSNYITSFLFGAAFAVGWTPCVSAALGAILALAASQPSSAFVLLVAYAAGVGLPFIIASLFLEKVSSALKRWARVAFTLRYVFAAIIIILGILIFTQRLNDIANLPFLVNSLASLGLGTSAGGGINSLTLFNIGISFVAGIFSFASPCILPLVPTFLSYLASLTIKDEK